VWKPGSRPAGVWIPPTGKQITVSGINIYHIDDGKIAMEWEQTDGLGMLGQLGALSRL
jgi:predicted ester cyclase